MSVGNATQARAADRSSTAAVAVQSTRTAVEQELGDVARYADQADRALEESRALIGGSHQDHDQAEHRAALAERSNEIARSTLDRLYEMDLYSYPDLAELANRLEVRLQEQSRAIHTQKSNISIARDNAIAGPAAIIGAATGAVLGGVVGGLGGGPVGAVAGATGGAALGAIAGGIVGGFLSIWVGN